MLDDWDELAPAQKAAPSKAPVRVGVSIIGRHGSARMAVYVRTAVLDELGGRARRYRASLGKGGNRTLLRIAQGDDAPFEATELGTAKGGGTWRILLPPNERVPNCKVLPVDVKYEVRKKGELLITLPSWAWDDREREKVQKQAAAAGAATVAAAHGLRPDDAISKLLAVETRERLCEMAREAGKKPNAFAADLITTIVEEDGEAEAA